MSSNLHPIMAQALAPWMPKQAQARVQPALAAIKIVVPTMSEQLKDEYRTGLDKTGPQWGDDE